MTFGKVQALEALKLRAKNLISSTTSAPGKCLRAAVKTILLKPGYRIQNPLHGVPKEKLLSQVEDFAKEKGMEDITVLLQKGALVAQNPSQFEIIQELDEADREALRRETTRMYF
jgi:hypothetical protein